MLDGLDVDKLDVNGLNVDGWYVDRLEVDGMDVDGLDVDGLEVEGLEVDRLDVDVLEVDGLNVMTKGCMHIVRGYKDLGAMSCCLCALAEVLVEWCWRVGRVGAVGPGQFWSIIRILTTTIR